MLEALNQQASAAPRQLRNAILAHLADTGPVPDPSTDAEGLTWWAARLMSLRNEDKLNALMMTDTAERACMLLGKMPNSSRASLQVINMLAGGSGGRSFPLSWLGL